MQARQEFNFFCVPKISAQNDDLLELFNSNFHDNHSLIKIELSKVASKFPNRMLNISLVNPIAIIFHSPIVLIAEPETFLFLYWENRKSIFPTPTSFFFQLNHQYSGV